MASYDNGDCMYNPDTSTLELIQSQNASYPLPVNLLSEDFENVVHKSQHRLEAGDPSNGKSASAELGSSEDTLGFKVSCDLMHSKAEGDISVDGGAVDSAGRTARNLAEEQGLERAIKALDGEQSTGYDA